MTTTTVCTSRERVRRALLRQEVDRVPCNYHGNGGINERLRAHLGCPDHASAMRRLGVDIAALGAPYRGPTLHQTGTNGVVIDPQWGHHRRQVFHASGSYLDFCDFPLANADLATVRAWPLPDPDDYDYAAIGERIAEAGDLALHVGGAGTGCTMNTASFFFGMDEMLVRLAEEDEALLSFIDRIHAINLTVARRVLKVAGERADFLWIGEDLGSQRGPLISTDFFERHIRPRLQPFIDLAKAHKLPVLMHSCGSSWSFFDTLSTMGVDAMDTLQPETEGMQPERLTAGWGDRLAFHGGLSTAGLLATGSAEEAYDEARRVIAAFTAGGSYLFAPTHAVQDNTSAENVVAAFRACADHGGS